MQEKQVTFSESFSIELSSSPKASIQVQRGSREHNHLISELRLAWMSSRRDQGGVIDHLKLGTNFHTTFSEWIFPKAGITSHSVYIVSQSSL